jgi:hypothetical protein
LWFVFVLLLFKEIFSDHSEISSLEYNQHIVTYTMHMFYYLTKITKCMFIILVMMLLLNTDLNSRITSCWVLVAHAYNPSYSGGRDQEECSSKPAQAKSL